MSGRKGATNGARSFSSNRSGVVRYLAETVFLAVILLLSLFLAAGGRSGVIPGGGVASSLLLLAGAILHLYHFRTRPLRPTWTAARRWDLTMLVAGLGLPILCAAWPLSPQPGWAPGGWERVHLLLVVPVSEELYFRGSLLGYLHRGFGTVRAVLFCSVLFLLLHPPFAPMIVAGCLSIAACILVIRGGSLILAVQLHTLWNGLTFINRIDDDATRWIYAFATVSILAFLFAILFAVRLIRAILDRRRQAFGDGLAG